MLTLIKSLNNGRTILMKSTESSPKGQKQLQMRVVYGVKHLTKTTERCVSWSNAFK